MSNRPYRLPFSHARRSALFAGLAGMAGTFAIARVLAADTPAAGAAQIHIENFTFTPDSLTVPVGTTVTWENTDDIPHTVVGPKAVFRSKPLDTGDRFSYTFKDAGEYSYFCSLHPHMVGKVIVTA